ncbi:hypothetical protein SB49_02425 [Sediminicola sp. YIK13]|nr:hypothetical protein SB49_02425 [Sediminicola sp. YIK13]
MHHVKRVEYPQIHYRFGFLQINMGYILSNRLFMKIIKSQTTLIAITEINYEFFCLKQYQKACIHQTKN